MRKLGAVVCLLLLASACSGSSETSETPTTTVTPTTVPPTTVTTTTVPPTTVPPTTVPPTTVPPTTVPTTTITVPTTTTSAGIIIVGPDDVEDNSGADIPTTNTDTTAFPVTTSTTVPPTKVSESIQLELPDDIGVSHFGHLTAGRDGGPGGWRRPHPGVFVWGLIEKTPGEYDWKRSDSLVTAIQQDRVGVLTTIWPFAEWDQNTCHADKPKAQPVFPILTDSLYKPCDIDAYIAWLEATIERYDGDGLNDMPGLEYPLRHWEVSNEPSMQQPDLTFFMGEPEDYLELLQVSYTAIKSVDPLAVVFPAGQAGMHESAADFWQPILEEGNEFFDVGNIHSISSSDTFFSEEYRNYLNDFGHQTKPFWVTEAAVGERLLKDRSEEEIAEIPFIGSVTSFVNGAEVVIAAALNKSPQKVLDAWNVVISTIGDFEMFESLTATSVRFDMRDGKTIYALWGGAKLPEDVVGAVVARRYDGIETVLDVSQVNSDLPMFVIID